jgi:serine/threonine protein kinase
MSPEQFQIDLDRFSDPNIDDVKPVPISIKSDIWSFGVMTSEIFSGVKPYHNISKKHAPTEQMITRRLIGNKPFPIPDSLDRDIREIVERATVVDPEERANTSEIRERFRKLIEMRQNNNNYENNNIDDNNNNHESNNNDNNNNINNNVENNKMEETL